MAKKQQLSYMQMPLPEGKNSYKVTKTDWRGLNKRSTIDTGVLSNESNISTSEAPFLTPSQKPLALSDKYRSTTPISMFGFDDFRVVIYRQDTQVKIDYITPTTTYTGVLKNNGATSNDDYQRTIVKFNVFENPTKPTIGTYTKKLLIFPDKKSIDFTITSDNFTVSDLTGVPYMDFVVVHLSRVFGVGDGKIYASAFNNYANWILDTTNNVSANNSWMSPAQSNTKASGSFTGITVFQNHIICFKDNFMHEIYNNKNPFRIQDIFNEGTIDNRSIQEVDGKLIFVAKDNVKIYNGGNPRNIGFNLNMSKFTTAVAGADDRFYYLYCKDASNYHNLFVYDTLTEQWSEQAIDFEVKSFAHNKEGMFMLSSTGYTYKMDSGDFSHDWWCETDLFIGKTIDIKQIRKLQLLADIANDSILSVYILYDDEVFNSSTSQKVYTYINSTGDTVRQAIRVTPRQTSSYGFKIRFVGYGYCKLYQLETFMKQGGELYV